MATPGTSRCYCGSQCALLHRHHLEHHRPRQWTSWTCRPATHWCDQVHSPPESYLNATLPQDPCGPKAVKETPVSDNGTTPGTSMVPEETLLSLVLEDPD